MMETAVLKVIKDLNKLYGDGTIVAGGDIQQDVIPRMTSGSLGLDLILGGGWPCNQAVEVVGASSNGKTAVALKTIAANQERNPDFVAVWVAAEEWVPGYAEMCGVDVSRVLVVETNVMEQAFEAVARFADTKGVDCIVIDSLPALIPAAEDDKTMEDMTVGRGALVTNRFFRKIGKSLKRSLIEEQRPVCLLVINQWRCIDADTPVWTERGLLPASEVVVGDVLRGTSGGVSVRGVAYSGVVDGTVIRARGCRELRVSENHRQTVVGENGTLTEKSAIDVVPGDWVVRDGKVFSSDTPNTQVQGAEVGRFVDGYRLGYVGKDKAIPRFVREGSAAVRREFLRHASFDTHIRDRNNFRWTFETEDQAGEVLLLLAGFGVHAQVALARDGRRSHLVVSDDDAVRFVRTIGFAEPRKQAHQFAAGSGGSRGKYDVVPTSVAAPLFNRAKQVSGATKLREYRALNQMSQGVNSGRRTLIRFLEWANTQEVGTFDDALALLRGVRFAQVEYVGPCRIDAVDFEVSGDGRFFAGGILTHNSKIGVTHGDDRTTPGGQGKDYAYFVRLEVKRDSWQEIGTGQDKKKVGQGVRFRTIKNKTARPQQTAYIDFYFADGGAVRAGDYDFAKEMLSIAVKVGVVDRKGSWLYFGDRQWQGGDAMLSSLREEIDLKDAIEAKVREIPQEVLVKTL